MISSLSLRIYDYPYIVSHALSSPSTVSMSMLFANRRQSHHNNPHMDPSERHFTSALRHASPLADLSDGSNSDEDEWHDAPDQSDTDAAATAVPSRPKSPQEVAKREQTLKVDLYCI